jgi:hypothetical protein
MATNNGQRKPIRNGKQPDKAEYLFRPQYVCDEIKTSQGHPPTQKKGQQQQQQSRRVKDFPRRKKKRGAAKPCDSKAPLSLQARTLRIPTQ